MKTEILKEKKIDIMALWKAFINPQAEELTQEEVIMKDSNISEQTKKELLKSLKNSEKFTNDMYKNSYATNLKPKTKIQKVQIKNPEIETKVEKMSEDMEKGE